MSHSRLFLYEIGSDLMCDKIVIKGTKFVCLVGYLSFDSLLCIRALPNLLGNWFCIPLIFKNPVFNLCCISLNWIFLICKIGVLKVIGIQNILDNNQTIFISSVL